MRARQVPTHFWISETVAAVGFFQRLLFQALCGLADREGLLLYRPGEIRPQAFPHDTDVTKDTVISGINDLVAVGLVSIIARSDGTDQRAIFIPLFKEYQWINKDEARSKLYPLYFADGSRTPAAIHTDTAELPAIHMDSSESHSSSLSLCDSGIQNFSHSDLPPAPRKRGERVSPYQSQVADIVEHLNATTGKRHSLDHGNAEIEKALKRGACVEDCKLVISHLWREWGGDSKMAKHVNKITPFRKEHFDRYLDEAKAGAPKSGSGSTGPTTKPLDQVVLADAQALDGDETTKRAWISQYPREWHDRLAKAAGVTDWSTQC